MGMKVSKSRHNYIAKHWFEKLQNSAQRYYCRDTIAILALTFMPLQRNVHKWHTHCRHTQWLLYASEAQPGNHARHNNNAEIWIGSKYAKNVLIHLIVAVKVMCLIIWRPLFDFLDCLTSFCHDHRHSTSWLLVTINTHNTTYTHHRFY